MIGLIRIGRCFPSLWLPLFSAFSVEKARSNLSQSAQRAIWATAVVKQISFSEGPNDIKTSSLREKILSFKKPSDGIEDATQLNLLLEVKTKNGEKLLFDDEIRKQVLGIFQDGIPLSPTVFSQNRIIQGIDQYIKIVGRKIQYKHLFAFCPNFLVTKQMFRYLLRLKTSHSLIYGGFGISKTVSIVLFNHLSSLINKFYYQSFTNQAFKQEFQFLKDNYLDLKIPKLFYWSLNLKNDEDKLKTIILQQAKELSAEQKQQLHKIIQFQKFVKYVFDKYDHKGINTLALIDQVNIIASRFRQWNNFYANYQDKQNQWQQKIQKIQQEIKLLQLNKRGKGIKNKIKEKKMQKEQQMFGIKEEKKNWHSNLSKMEIVKTQGEILQSRMKSFQKIGTFIFYNSSIDIQKQLYIKQNHLLPEKNMGLQDGQTFLRTFQVPYFTNLNTKWGRNDFSQYFWFQIEKKLKISKQFTMDQLNSLKTIFYQYAKQKKWPIFVRFLNIANMIREDKNQWFGPNLKVIFSKEKFKDTAQQIIAQLQASSKNEYKQHLRKFLRKGNVKQKQQKLTFLNIIFSLAEFQDQKSNQNLQIYISDIKSTLQASQLRIYLELSYTSKEIFSVTFSQKDPKIRFFWTPKQFIDIVNGVLYQLTINNEIVDQRLTKIVLARNKGVQGTYLETALMLALKEPKMNFSYRKLDGTSCQFAIKQSSTFIQFNQTVNQQKNQTITIQNNLNQIMILAKRNPEQFIFGQPIRMDKNSQIESPNSAVIDFLLIQYSPPTNQTPEKYNIYSFDITNSSDYKNKIPKAQERFIKLQRRNKGINYKIYHTIIGGVQHKDKIIGTTYEISTSLVENVKVFSFPFDYRLQSICQGFLTQQKYYSNNKEAKKIKAQKKQ